MCSVDGPFPLPGGYSSEAWSYITSLSSFTKTHNFSLKILPHGDSNSFEFFNGLPEKSKNLAYELYNADCELSESIVVCHSEPGAWFPPLFQTLPCPPTGYQEPLFVVGRTMFETDRINPNHVERCNRMDKIWVPSEFHVSMFVDNGVDESKVAKLVQPVDVEFFDPSKYQAFALESIKPVVGSRCGDNKDFVFLSVFKWEQRKGWDVLLKAFLSEFSRSDCVSLYLLVSAYHSDTKFGAKISNFVKQTGLVPPADGWAGVHVINVHVAQSDLPRLYKAADAFVLPTRGEGWGRPIVEAMAMALPVIATNWSGPTEYLTEENGYPLPIDEMSEVSDGPFVGHKWAEPSSERLRVLMRRVVSDREEGRRRGRRAREDMMKRFSPEVVGRILADEILGIVRMLG
ncbi:LOW QUALITY PROTEIN: uncharacterized protein LOC109824738 [Asparagus officinalis]|uniref:LOW QUALITY PROTEIN: uncharacterized protein LOC109824738 n=1 Tax=Asparagus officinalis TaxID=4686 RepID=UPI00098DE2B7|nr:LOW QUALITY PROTEIN: uncharacterized protein LOC109824738 [Asparagus officinalis]